MNFSAITEISGNRRVSIDGCDGIIDFNDENICLRSGKLKISINGKELKIKILSQHTALVEGLILSVNFNYL